MTEQSQPERRGSPELGNRIVLVLNSDGTGERDARPGELCSCGKPAIVVYFTEAHGEVPWCGEYGDGG